MFKIQLKTAIHAKKEGLLLHKQRKIGAIASDPEMWNQIKNSRPEKDDIAERKIIHQMGLQDYIAKEKITHLKIQ